MSSALYIVLALGISAFLGWLAVRVIAKSAASRGTGRPSPFMVVAAIGSWGFLTFLVMSLALSTTNVVQTSVIVANMEQNPPFSAIARSDPTERDRLRRAVSNGLVQAKGGDVRESMMRSVSTELAPYMNRRLAAAPDSVYLELAPIVADGLRQSRLMGQCALPSDRGSASLRHHLDPQRIMAWAERLVSTPPARPTGGGSVEARRASLVDRAVERGIPRDQAMSTLVPDAGGLERCSAAASMLTMAAADPDRARGADDVRLLLSGFQLPG